MRRSRLQRLFGVIIGFLPIVKLILKIEKLVKVIWDRTFPNSFFKKFVNRENDRSDRIIIYYPDQPEPTPGGENIPTIALRPYLEFREKEQNAWNQLWSILLVYVTDKIHQWLSSIRKFFHFRLGCIVLFLFGLILYHKNHAKWTCLWQIVSILKGQSRWSTKKT